MVLRELGSGDCRRKHLSYGHWHIHLFLQGGGREQPHAALLNAFDNGKFDS